MVSSSVPASRPWLKFRLLGVVALSAVVFFFADKGMATPPAAVIYADQCVVCHGVDGAGAMPGIPDLTESNGRLSKPDPDLVRSIVEGIDYPGIVAPMPPSGLDEKTATEVLMYLRATASGGN